MSGLSQKPRRKQGTLGESPGVCCKNQGSCEKPQLKCSFSLLHQDSQGLGMSPGRCHKP